MNFFSKKRLLGTKKVLSLHSLFGRHIKASKKLEKVLERLEKDIIFADLLRGILKGKKRKKGKRR